MREKEKERGREREGDSERERKREAENERKRERAREREWERESKITTIKFKYSVYWNVCTYLGCKNCPHHEMSAMKHSTITTHRKYKNPVRSPDK